jgi:hypothetical protein
MPSLSLFSVLFLFFSQELYDKALASVPRNRAIQRTE